MANSRINCRQRTFVKCLQRFLRQNLAIKPTQQGFEAKQSRAPIIQLVELIIRGFSLNKALVVLFRDNNRVFREV